MVKLTRDLIQQCANSYPNKIAYWDGDRSATWPQMHSRSDRFAAAMQGLGIGKGDAVIINAASSSVGLAAISLCNRVGATAIAVTRGSDKREALLQHGADAVVVSNEEDIAESVKSITDGKGARLAFDPVAGDGVLKLAEALGPQGQIIIYGNLSGNAHNTPFPYGQGMAKGLSVRAYLVFELIRDQVRRERAIAGILEGYADGSIRPVTDKVFDFNEMVEAHRYLEGSTQFGKVMVKVG
jgi:NADPH:quinone reductase-like Zn-dependent oxidoreductase